MNIFRVDFLCFLLDGLHSHESNLVRMKMAGQGAAPIPEPHSTEVRGLVDQAIELFKQDGLKSCAEAAASAKFYLERKGADVSSGMVTLNRLKSDVLQVLSEHRFLRVAADRPQCVDNEMAFGQDVFDAFSSARRDIKEAYNCMAAECSTAAVFHLMRAAEAGLRALAFDRGVKIFPNKKTMVELPLNLATWDQIIKELEEAELAIEGYPRTLTRQDQFDFYHGANMQFRAFKNVFRNCIMHSRESYDRDEATSLSHKVGEFMQILASKIHEGDQTPTVWV